MLQIATSADAILLHSADNVCVAARFFPCGTEVDAGQHHLVLRDDIRPGHKIALERIEAGQPVRKYGQIIGFATETIEPGQWVHSHNLAAGEFTRDYAYCSAVPPTPQPITDRTFMGYRRADGRAGTRNYLAVISSVNCSASVSRFVAQRFDAAALRAFPNVDGVVAFTHSGGCGMQFGGDNHKMLNRVLGGIARHPNIGGYLLLGLGCETGAMGYLLDDQRLVQIGGLGADNRAPGGVRRPPVMAMQDLGGTQKTIEAASRLVAEMLPQVNDVRREPLPASQIVLGLECGGSDGNSGVTANPALGVASDLLVACGGTAILAETTEIYGAEQLLTRRAVSPEVADKLIARIKWWEWYTSTFGAKIDNNPSPGNKEGGLTTIYEKSLGAVAKGGSTALVDVYEYAEQVTAKGFVVMDTPGFDPVSVTGMVAGGANVVVFTTGRGSCFGCKPTPSIKVATNTPMYERLIDDMDLNAGTILDGRSIEAVGHEIFEEVLAVASGKKTKSELQGIGDEEFIPWHLGPVL
jgi:altronate hydrolase